MPERPPQGDGPRDDDRFGDLGAGRSELPGDEPGSEQPHRRSAAERFAERDEIEQAEQEEQRLRRPGPPKPSSRYAWFIGFAFVIVAAAAATNLVIGGNAGRSIRGPEAGSQLPQFAAPLATGDVEGDANVRQPAGGSEREGRHPACEIRTRDVLTSCDLYRRTPAVISVLFDRGADCEPQIDRVERVRPRFPDVSFATVFFSRKEREEIAQIVRRRRWQQPVAVDHDGAITNVLGVGGCPLTIFVERGGKVRGTEITFMTEDEVAAEIRELQRAGSVGARRSGG